mgnify:CR=1 FL=1
MGFIQVPPDSTGKLVDTTIVAGQHRENIIIGDPTTAAALGSVVRTPNADLAAGNPGGVGGVVTRLDPVTSYAPAVAGHDQQQRRRSPRQRGRGAAAACTSCLSRPPDRRG